MNAYVFPIFVIFVWSLIALATGYGLRKWFGQNALLLTVVLIFLLMPWWAHFQIYLNAAEQGWASSSAANETLPGKYLGPALLSFLICISVTLRRYIRVLIPAIPYLAFLITWKLVFPTWRDVVPDYYEDNMPSIWLAIWTIGATLLLVVYWWPVLPFHKFRNSRSDSREQA